MIEHDKGAQMERDLAGISRSMIEEFKWSAITEHGWECNQERNGGPT